MVLPLALSGLITPEELKTLPVGVMITVPTVGFFAAVQRFLVQGWGAGGVKG